MDVAIEAMKNPLFNRNGFINQRPMDIVAVTSSK